MQNSTSTIRNSIIVVEIPFLLITRSVPTHFYKTKRTMKRQLFLICVGLLIAVCSLAQIDQEVSFSVTVSYDTVGLEERFEVKYTVKNTKVLGNFTPPTFDGFQLVGGPMTSQQMNYVNGQMSQSLSYTYILKPTDLGAYNIMGVSVETEKGMLVTDDIAVVVVDEVDRPVPPTTADPFHRTNPFRQNPFGQDPFDDPFFNQSFDMQKKMDEMRKQMEEMYKGQPPVNQSPKKKKKKKKGKVYKI